MFAFEWTLRAGDLLPLIGGIGIAAAFLYRRGGDDTSVRIAVHGIKEELSEMKTEFKSFGVTLSKVAIQEMQIGLLMKWYDELRNGRGYIVPRDRGEQQP